MEFDLNLLNTSTVFRVRLKPHLLSRGSNFTMIYRVLWFGVVLSQFIKYIAMNLDYYCDKAHFIGRFTAFQQFLSSFYILNLFFIIFN